MVKLFRKIVKTDLFKTSFLSSIANIIQIIAGFVVNKVIAVYIGAEGIALLGQFKNFTTGVTNFANGGIMNGIVKYIAESPKNNFHITRIISNSLLITFISSFLISGSLILFRNKLAEYIFSSTEYTYLILLLSATIILFALNSVLMSILNGLGQISRLVLVKISNSIVILFLTSLLSIFFHIKGALISVAISQSIVFFVSLTLVIKQKWNLSLFFRRFNFSTIKNLLSFSVMTIPNYIIIPFIRIQVRNYIIDTCSLKEAGYWDSMMNISKYYLTFITVPLSIYYLPKLSSINNASELRKEILTGYKVLLPVLFVVGATIYFFRKAIIHILFTRSFFPMEKLFLVQLIGDFFMIAAWLLAYLMIAKAKAKLYLSTQILFSILFYVLSVLYINAFGLIGVTYAYLTRYILFAFAMLIIFRNILINKPININK